MGGIAGILDAGWNGAPGELAALTGRLTAPLAHRGPDGSGTWCDPEAGIGMGHCRLAVIDPSDAGSQPMVSADGRWVIAYNGECYNAPELRRALGAKGVSWRGYCDTEIVLEAVAAWGVEVALRRTNAMFAFALWDRRERRLWLARDRLGEKPLYYAVVGKTLVFGSELCSVTAYPAFDREIDRQALDTYLQLTYIPAPRTIYAAARKLAAGSLLRIGAERSGRAQTKRWWDFEAVTKPSDATTTAGAEESTAQIEKLLHDSVARRTIADVPVGVYLSGGIDSSLVAALAQEHLSKSVPTFTIAFPETGEIPLNDDVSARARAIARRLGTDHTQIDVTPADAVAALPDLARCWDEPLADPSLLPTFLLARQTRPSISVALAGDGGDEVFGGRHRYTHGSSGQRWARLLPRSVVHNASRLLDRIGPRAWNVLEQAVTIRHPAVAPPDLSTKARKLSRVLDADSTAGLYTALVSSHAPFAGSGWPGPPALRHDLGPAESMMAWDTMSVLPDALLAMIDRATMRVGLETRLPMLDHRLVEAAWQLPLDQRIDGSHGKVVLRKLLRKRLPASLLDQPKLGCDLPLAAWLRGPLRSWAEDLLSPDRLVRQGFFDPITVGRCWRDHQSGRANREDALWSALAFQSWLESHDNTPAFTA